MKILCFLLCIASAKSYYVSDDTTEKSKIVGGNFTKAEIVPYQAGLLVNSMFNGKRVSCGGTIIDRLWILTAAHCTNQQTCRSVITGGVSPYREDGGSEHQIAFVIEHPLFNNVTLDNDIALIKLSKAIKFNERQYAIGIAKWDEVPQENQQMLISGFGNEQYKGRSSRWLKAAYVPVANQKSCVEKYRNAETFKDVDKRRLVTENMFCAGNGTVDACQGDSGGPAVIKNKLHGIVSFGAGCANNYYPGVYTRVHKYYHWIVENILKHAKGYKS